MTRCRAFALGLLAALLPAVAQACAVCGAGNPANRFAFFLSTIGLSLLPLGLFAGGLLWLRARLGSRLAEEFTERDAVVSEARPGIAPPSSFVPDLH